MVAHERAHTLSGPEIETIYVTQGCIAPTAGGPLTNLALMLDRAPEAAARIRRVIAMGGAVDEPGNVGPKAEFNIAHDPHAAAAVLGSGLPLTLIPLDATRQLRADATYIAALREAQNYVRAYTRGLGIFELPEYLAWPDWDEWDPLVSWLNSRRSQP